MGVQHLGPVSILRSTFLCMGIPMLKIRRSRDLLIFNMVIPLPVRWYLYIQTAPWIAFNMAGALEAMLTSHLSNYIMIRKLETLNMRLQDFAISYNKMSYYYLPIDQMWNQLIYFLLHSLDVRLNSKPRGLTKFQMHGLLTDINLNNYWIIITSIVLYVVSTDVCYNKRHMKYYNILNCHISTQCHKWD